MVTATNVKVTLWACTGCGYYFWGGDAEAPDNDHCSNGYWVSDHNALAVPMYGKHSLDNLPYWIHP